MAYLALALVSFPILEIILRGENAVQYAHDVFDDDVPRLFSIASDWLRNGPVLWDPHLTAGNPLLAQFALPPFAPDVLLSFVIPPFAAYTLNATFMAFAAGLSMHVFLRGSLRLVPVACFIGGILAALAFWHYIYGYAVLLLPLLLWGVDRMSRTASRRRDALFVILLISFLLYSSQIQIILIDGAVTLAWVLLRGPEEHGRGRRVRDLVVTWAIAFALAAPVLATQIVGLPASQRAIWELTSGFSLAGQLREALEFYGRVIFGVPLLPSIGGSGDVYGTFFLGAIALPLLVVGCVVPRRPGRERFLLALLVLIPIIDILAPLLVPLQENVGFLRSFQFVRIRHLLPIVLIVNAAIGANWLAGPDPFGRLSRARRWAAAAGLGAVGMALFAQGSVAVRRVLAGTGGPRVEEGWLLAAVALIGGTFVALVVGYGIWRHGRLPVSGQGVLAGGIVVLLLLGLTGERLALTRAQRDLGAPRLLGTWADRVALTPAQGFIASQSGGGRTLSIGEHANRALVAGLDAVDGYQTIYPLRYHELFGAMIGPQLALDPANDRYYNTWGNRAYAFGPELDMEVASLLGVRWLYVAGDVLTDPSLIERFSAAGVTVYENPDAFPRAFIVTAATIAEDRPAVIAAIAEASAPDLRDRVFVASEDVPADWAGLVGGDPLGARAAGAGPGAVIETDSIDRLSIRTTTSTAGILVLTDTWTPDWVAEVDGVDTPIAAVDGALRGVAVPAGEHVVSFAYRPMATYAGIVAAMATALALGGWLTLGWLRRRQEVRPETGLDRLE